VRNPDPAVWRAWCDGELRWQAERLPDLFAELQSDELGSKLRVLSELSLHPLYAHDIGAEVALLVADAPAGVALAGVQLLIGFGGPSSIPAFEAAARRSEPELARTAAAALATLNAASPVR
jgi:hypothetical protein